MELRVSIGFYLGKMQIDIVVIRRWMKLEIESGQTFSSQNFFDKISGLRYFLTWWQLCGGTTLWEILEFRGTSEGDGQCERQISVRTDNIASFYEYPRFLVVRDLVAQFCSCWFKFLEINAMVCRPSSWSCSMAATMAYLHASVITNIFFFGSNCASTGVLMMEFLSSWNALLTAHDQLNGTFFVNSVSCLAVFEKFLMNLW